MVVDAANNAPTADRPTITKWTADFAALKPSDLTTEPHFVQSIDGIDGSVTARRDWFYFVNGIEGPRGAQEYRLHDGDVLWWDYRDWTAAMRVPAVASKVAARTRSRVSRAEASRSCSVRSSKNSRRPPSGSG